MEMDSNGNKTDNVSQREPVQEVIPTLPTLQGVDNGAQMDEAKNDNEASEEMNAEQQLNNNATEQTNANISETTTNEQVANDEVEEEEDEDEDVDTPLADDIEF